MLAPQFVNGLGQEADDAEAAVGLAPQGGRARRSSSTAPTAPGGSSVGPLTRAQFDEALVFIADASGAMMLAQSQTQRIGNALGQAQIGEATGRQQAAEQAFQAATKAVERLAKKHRGLFHRFKWLKPLIKAVAVVVAVVATVFSVGAAGPVAMAGLILMFSAEYITKGLVALGIVPEDKAMWVTMALKLVGAALSLGAGLASAGTEAASVGIEVADAVNQVAELVQVVLIGMQAGVNIDAAYIQRAMDRSQADSVRAQDQVHGANEDIGDGVDWLRDVSRRHQRVMQRIAGAQTVRDQAQMATVGMLA